MAASVAVFHLAPAEPEQCGYCGGLYLVCCCGALVHFDEITEWRELGPWDAVGSPRIPAGCTHCQPKLCDACRQRVLQITGCGCAL